MLTDSNCSINNGKSATELQTSIESFSLIFPFCGIKKIKLSAFLQ